MKEPVRSHGRRGVLAAVAVAGAALTLGAAPAAQAADDCPNAAVRAQQSSARLLECRAFELVSPADKNGHKVQLTRFVAPVGGAAHFRSTGSFAGARSNIGGEFAAHRTDSGWVTTPFSPAFDGDRIPRLNDSPRAEGFSEDLTKAVISTRYPLYLPDSGATASGPRSTFDLFLVNSDGSHSWLSSGTPDADASSSEVTFVAASDDLSSVLMLTGRQLDPAAGVPDESIEHLYLRRPGRATTLVSVGPDGLPLPIGPGNVLISDDGSRILLDSEPSFFGTGRPLLFDPVSGTTTVPTFGPDRRVCDVGTIERLSGDGRTLIFRCSTQLTDDAPAGWTLYRADLETGAVSWLGLGGSVIDATDDLSSSLVLDSGALWSVGDGPPEQLVETFSVTQSQMSPDGEYVAFKTPADLGFPTTSLFGELYLYSRASGTTSCLTCTPGGNSVDDTGGLVVGGSIPQGLVTDAGEVFYTANLPLVPTDVNGRSDAYMWKDGRPHLISSGTADTDAWVVSAADDGREAYLISSERLAPQDVDNGIPDLYAAKVGGGFVMPAAAPGCIGDCQGEPQPFAPPTDLGTTLFTGPEERDDPVQPPVAKVFGVTPLGSRALAGWARRGRTALDVEVSHAGTVRAVVRAKIGRRRGVVVASATRRALRGGTVRLTLRLSGAARRALRRQGSLTVALRVSYSGRPGAQTTTLTLRAPSKRGAAR